MLSDVLLVQKREMERRWAECYIERDVSPVMDKTGDLIRVIIGLRRAGKSFFALHILRLAGNCGYVNFDDERLLGTRDYDDILIGKVCAGGGLP